MEFYYTYMYTNLFSRVLTVLLALSWIGFSFDYHQYRTSALYVQLELTPAASGNQLPSSWDMGSPKGRLRSLYSSPNHGSQWPVWRPLCAGQGCRLGVLRIAHSDRIFRSTGNVTPITGSCPGPKRRQQCLRSSPSTRPASEQQATATGTSPSTTTGSTS